jgi:hypothetical protein
MRERFAIRRHCAMGTPNDIQEPMKLKLRELPSLPPAPAMQRMDDASAFSKVLTRAPSGCVIDFFAARDWLQTGFAEGGPRIEIHQKPDELAAQRLPSVERVDRLEESLYWLLSAATLIYFLFGIIGS